MTESKAGKKILILEDEESVLTYLQTLLEDNGYDTVTAMDGEEGLDKARSERPDLVTLDISMPKKSGISFYRTLREEEGLKHIKVVVVTGVTGFGGKPDLGGALRLGDGELARHRSLRQGRMPGRQSEHAVAQLCCGGDVSDGHWAVHDDPDIQLQLGVDGVVLGQAH